MSIQLDPTQQDHDAGETDTGTKSKSAPRRHKIIASGEFMNMKPAHQRFVTKTGQGSSLRTAATDALDQVLKDDRVKALRNKLPFKVVFQSGE